MKLLLDEGVPLRTAAYLRDAGQAAEHIIELNLRGMADAAILDKARQEGAVIVTLDADFHKLLAASGDAKPSVVRLRVEHVAPLAMAEMIGQIVAAIGDRLEAGVAVSATLRHVRVRALPIGEPPSE